ncbi:MAG TPA: glycosyltransferase family 87 protein [Acidobacteriaceae bacterium]|nr:glycosyltransferase family 87 protein [Acidobacteriaceae bacterium]
MMPVPAKYRSLITNLLLLALGAVYVQYCRDGVQEFHHYINGYSMDVLYQICIYITGALLIWFGKTSRWTLPIIFVVALAARVVCIAHPAFLSSDLYRYVWDGKVQAAGINPYRYIPADDHLRFLRDNAIYPNINRKDYAHTIYPPFAQMLFWAVTRISATEAGMKTAMVAFEALTCWALMQMLELLHRRREEVLLYAWHPLCVWEIGSSGHIDAAAIALITVAAWAILRNKPARSAVWLTLAALIKMYPALLLLSFGRRLTWKIVAMCSVIVAISYAIYSSVGTGVLGFLGPYSREERLNTGERYFVLAWLHRYLHVPEAPQLYIIGAILTLVGCGIWSWRRMRSPMQILRIELAISVVITILFSPHYPWYFLWTLPLAIVCSYLPAIVLTLDAVYWYATDIAIPGQKMFRMNEYMYSIFLGALVFDLTWRWLQRRRKVSVITGADLSERVDSEKMEAEEA